MARMLGNRILDFIIGMGIYSIGRVHFKGKPISEIYTGNYSYSSNYERAIELIDTPGSRLVIGNYCSIGPRLTLIMAGEGPRDEGHTMDSVTTYPIWEFL